MSVEITLYTKIKFNRLKYHITTFLEGDSVIWVIIIQGASVIAFTSNKLFIEVMQATEMLLRGCYFKWTQIWLKIFFSLNRGVFQSLIEKHFPAPDRKKLFSLLGIDLTAQSNNNSPRDSPCKENKIKKRKGNTAFYTNTVMRIVVLELLRSVL